MRAFVLCSELFGSKSGNVLQKKGIAGVQKRSACIAVKNARCLRGFVVKMACVV
jgi:hypothetical protein